MLNKHARNPRPSQVYQRNEEWLNTYDLAPASSHRAPRNYVKKSSVRRAQANRTHGLKGEWGNGPALRAPRL